MGLLGPPTAPAAGLVPVARVTVAGGPGQPTVPSGFVGLSTEYAALPAYAGTDPRAIDPVFVRLLENLDPGQQPALRIGGDSSDRTWWPVAGMARPAGVADTVTPRWMALTRAVALALRARVTLGINLEADNARLAGAEARALLAGVGRDTIRALELGNEPEYYSARWYQTPQGVTVPGRAPGYDPTRYNADFARIAAALPPFALAAPATGSRAWLNDLPALRAHEPRLQIATVHAYALSRCVTDPANPAYPTLAHLMTARSSRGLTSELAAEAALAHEHGLRIRMDELNAVTCQGRTGVSDTFGSALWLLDTLMAAARSGIDGVNIHVWPGAAPNQLFTFAHRHGRWTGSVRPNYYGALLFTEAAPPGARFLPAGSSGGGGQLRVWATRGTDGRLRVVLINVSAHRAHPVTVALRGAPAGPAALTALRAPGLSARARVTLGGRSFGGQTASGRLAAPTLAVIVPRHGTYHLRLPAASATMLTVAP